jgi:hypothetical protein
VKTRVEHDEPDLGTCGGERLHEHLGRHHLAMPLGAVEHHAAGLIPGGRGGNGIAALRPIRGAGRPRTVSAEMHDGGLQLA